MTEPSVHSVQQNGGVVASSLEVDAVGLGERLADFVEGVFAFVVIRVHFGGFVLGRTSDLVLVSLPGCFGRICGELGGCGDILAGILWLRHAGWGRVVWCGYWACMFSLS